MGIIPGHFAPNVVFKSTGLHTNNDTQVMVFSPFFLAQNVVIGMIDLALSVVFSDSKPRIDSHKMLFCAVDPGYLALFVVVNPVIREKFSHQMWFLGGNSHLMLHLKAHFHGKTRT